MKKFWDWKSRKIRDQASGEEVSERVLFLNGTIRLWPAAVLQGIS